MKTFISLLLTLLIYGCNATPEVYLAKDAVEVNEDTVGQYWKHKNTEYSFTINNISPDKQNKDGYVSVRYLIDSNGNTFQPEVLESHPKGMWDAFALKAVKHQQFVYAEENHSRIPVYYTQKLTFKGVK
ncbi:MAG: TonB family protein [Alteromonadaceae bacterium]|nr:TonB family protein [Alteromonadaceae bacterium]